MNWYLKAIIILIYILNPPQLLSQTMQYLGLENQNITSLCVNFNLIAAGTEKNGMFWKTEGQVTEGNWNNVQLNKKILTVYPHKSGPIGWAISVGVESNLNDSNLVYCSYMGEPFKSISAGLDYSRTYGVIKLDGFPDPTICGETFAVTGDALYRRNFSDSTWTLLREAYEGNFITVKVKETNPGVVILGGAVGFAGILLSKSTDFGDTWTDISPFGAINDLDFTGDSAETIFACAYSDVFRTTDNGKNWSKIFVSSASYIFTQILFEPLNKALYVSGFDTDFENTKPVLLCSADMGDTFEEIEINFTDEIVDLEPSSNFDDWIYLATKNEGVFRFKSNIVDVDDKNETSSLAGFELHQNYPNPFNPATKISYTIPSVGNESGSIWTSIQLKIYDVLGNEIATLVNDIQPPGNYEVEFNASHLVSGVYIYKIRTDSFVLAKKLLLMKYKLTPFYFKSGIN
jgi:hypothetical protein